jgi:diadenosine tetraphosphatase ApaH/serine/threonine PP2A family protein phosphatase
VSALQIALLSDIHSNVQALNACLRHAEERGAERLAFLGDFVGYGGDPRGVVQLIAERVALGAVALKGNHDEAIEKRGSYFNEAAQASLDLAREVLSADQKAFLAGLPLIVREDAICFTHASAASPEKWQYIDSPGAALRCANAAQASYTFCGHVHDQLLFFDRSGGRMSEFRPVSGVPIPVRGGRRWVALVGSVGQPRDRNPAAAYTMFDSTRQQVTFYRVAYDATAAAEKIRQCGLPESLAYRVELGI